MDHLRLSKYMLKRGHVEDGEKMERILEYIAKREPMELLYYPTVWFNAWKFTEGSQIWAALASDIINQLNGKQYALLTRLQFWLQLKRKRANLFAALGPVMLNLLVIIVLALVSVLYPSFIYPFIVSHVLPLFQTLFPVKSVAKGAASTTATIGGVALLLSTASGNFQSGSSVIEDAPLSNTDQYYHRKPELPGEDGYIRPFQPRLQAHRERRYPQLFTYLGDAETS